MLATAIQGNLATVRADALVNAANAALAGGGGVDGALHRAAGPELAAACRVFPWVTRGVRCPTGEVRVTPAFQLEANFVIHAVGPVYDSRDPGPSRTLLRQVHLAALAAAADRDCRSVAFPAISTGAFRFPVRDAARVAADAVAAWRAAHPSIELDICFVLFDAKTHRLYASALGAAATS